MRNSERSELLGTIIAQKSVYQHDMHVNLLQFAAIKLNSKHSSGYIAFDGLFVGPHSKILVK